jgi:hypothetical protein
VARLNVPEILTSELSAHDGMTIDDLCKMTGLSRRRVVRGLLFLSQKFRVRSKLDLVSGQTVWKLRN